MLISYAQNFEDVLLWRALKDVEHGLYIDVGAQDPVVDSVSRLFYDQGWRGIHVEATTTYANLLREARPDEIVFQVALADTRGTMTFYEIPDTGISTGDPTIAAEHKARGFQVVETRVPTLRLEDIFQQANREIHWLKIDVEGMEQQVLSGWGDAPVKPWIVCIESTLPLTQTESFSSWEDHLLGRGYEFVYFDGLNRYYISPEHPHLSNAFVNGPNLFDGFSLSGTASAPFSLHILQRHAQEKRRLEEHISGLKGRIAELEADPLREAQAMLSARIESLYSEAQRRQDEWIVQERALQSTIGDLNVRLLEIQHTQQISEKEAFASIAEMKDALREAEKASIQERERLKSELHGLELTVAEFNKQLRDTRGALEACNAQLVSERSQSAARLAERDIAHAALSAQAEQARLQLTSEIGQLQYEVDLERVRLKDALTQIDLAQDYIQSLRSSTSWRITGPLRKLSVLLGASVEGNPSFNLASLSGSKKIN